MSQIVINVPADQMDRVTKAFAVQNGRGMPPAAPPAPGTAGTGGAAPEPESDLEITKRALRDHIKAVVKSYEIAQAAAQAQTDAAKRVDDELNLT